MKIPAILLLIFTLCERATAACAAQPIPTTGKLQSATEVNAGNIDLAHLNADLQDALLGEQWTVAQAILSRYPESMREKHSMLLIKALILRHLKQPRRAIALYQRVIAKSHDAAPIRIALAYTYLDINATEAAELQFRLGLAGRLAPSVRALANQALSQILEQRHWIFNVNASISPDSNVNQGTDAKEVDLYGVPFQLSQDARRRANVNLTGSLGVDRIIHISTEKIVRISAYGRYSDNRGTTFDDALARFSIGPEIRHGRTRYGFHADWESRWYGGVHYSDAVSGQLEWERSFGSNTVVDIALVGQRYREPRNEARSGWIWGADAVRTHYLSPNRFWRLTLNARRANAKSRYEAYWVGRAAFGYYSNLYIGLAAFTEASYTRGIYDARVPAFDDRRVDSTETLLTRISKRDWNIAGFSPYTGITFTHTQSSVSIYKFDRTRFDIGITRTF